MIFAILATACAGLFAGAAIYITAVEHPARLSCGTVLALREFAPSYRRAAVMQASLAVLGCGAGLGAAWQLADPLLAVAALLLGAVVPITLMVVAPTNRRLLNPALDPDSPEAPALLNRWGRVHAVRTVLGTVAFGFFLWRLSSVLSGG